MGSLKFFKQKIESILSLGLLVGLIYLLINIIHLAWYIASPEGFWGFSYFFEILRTLLFIIPLLIILFLFIFLIFSYVSSVLKYGFRLKDFIKGTGICLLIIISIAFNEYYANSASLWFTQKMSDKYSYLEQSEKFIRNRQFKKALEYSQNAYEKYSCPKLPSHFFILSRLYSKTTANKNMNLTNRYASIVSLASCKEITSKNINEAEQLYKEALSLTESEDFFSNRKEYQILPLAALAYIKQYKRDYYESEKIFYRLEQISKNLSKKDLKFKIQGLLVFVNSSMRAGDLLKVESILNNILELYTTNELKEDTNFKSCLILKIQVDLNLNKFNSAKKNYKKLSELEISEKSALYPNYLSTKAKLYTQANFRGLVSSELEADSFLNSILKKFVSNRKVNLLEEAEKLYIKKIEIIKDSQGEESLAFFEAIKELANFLRENGSYAEAAKFYYDLRNHLNYKDEKFKDFYKDLLIDIISVDNNVNLHIVKEAEALVFEEVYSKLPFLTEREKETYISKIENQINIINNYYLVNETKKSTVDLYNNTLKFKEIALNSNRNIRNFLKKLPDSIIINYRKLISSVRNSSIDNTSYLREKEILNTLSIEENFSDYLSRNVDYRLVQNCLEDDEYALEIVNTPFINGDKLSFKYYALIIDNTLDTPIKVELFNKQDLDSILNIEGDAKSRYNILYDVNLDESELRNLIWKPIENIIKPASKVYISMSGDLNKIALPSLFVKLSSEIHLISSTKNIVDLDNGFYNHSKQNIAFGGANFKTISNSIDNRSLSSIKNNIIENLENGFYGELPYTIKEVESIKLVISQEEENCKVFKGNEASEANFRKIDGQNYGFVHIATHGFYFTQDELYSTRKKNVFKFSTDDSMGRSGILLTKSSNLDPSYENDGIVTAREISAMNLSNIDLLVLSACETGVGDYNGSEGIFGLQRALKLSGVKKQIVSLWQVPDKETSELFKLFYQFYVKGYSAYHSLKKAQLIMSSKYGSFYWAGFILIE